MTILNPYISFRDNARQALEFYHGVLGGSLELMPFSAMPEMGHDPAENDLIMHGMLTTDDGLVLMASDTPSTMEFAAPQGISISLSGDDGAHLHTLWDGLLDGGTVALPLVPAPWGGEFGMLVDRFGVSWMVSVNG